MYKRVINHLVLGVVFFILSLVFTQKTLAATLEFSPATGSYTTNTPFEIEITVDTGGEDTQSTDAVVEFDPSFLSVDNVTYGSFYPTVLHSVQNNKLYISGVVDSAGSVKNGSGTLATVSFKGLKAGTTTVSFLCEDGRTDDSNVTKNDIDATDLLVCSSLVDGSYTLSGETAPTNTPTETDTTVDETSTNETTTTSTNTTSEAMPATGFTDVFKLMPKIFMGLLFIAIGLIPLLV